MKHTIKICLTILFSAWTALITAQGTIVVTNPINTTYLLPTGNTTARDEVDVIPVGATGEVHLIPQSTTQNHLYIDPSIVLPALYQTSNGTAASNGTDITRNLNVSLAVGTTKGSYSTNKYGGLMYTIPIDLPPGTNDLVPDLAVVYNSFGENSIVGHGWDISGLSSIERKQRDIYHNNGTNPINLDNNDQFTLDGNVLIPITGNNGIDQTIYGTESADFSKIISNGNTLGNGPDWFKVQTKEGLTIEYGNTTDSRFIPGGTSTPLSWKINKISDNYGNYILFQYHNLNAEQYIEKISYTGNNNLGFSPYNSINFYYETREIQDQNIEYTNKGVSVQTAILRKIVIQAEGVTAKSFDFNYESNNNQSFLNELVEYGCDNQKYNSMLFSYSVDDYQGAAYAESSPLTAQTLNLTQANIYELMRLPMDADGDGKSDIFRFESSFFRGNLSQNQQVYNWDIVKNNGGTTSLRSTFTTKITNNVSNLAGSPSAPYGWSFAQPMDLDGDGKDDLVFVEVDVAIASLNTIPDMHLYTCLAANNFALSAPILIQTDISASLAQQNIQFLDMNGDGRKDIVNQYVVNTTTHAVKVYFDVNNLSNSITQTFSNLYDYTQSFPGDIDGDGKEELMNVIYHTGAMGLHSQYILRYNNNTLYYQLDNPATRYNYSPYNYAPAFQTWAPAPTAAAPLDFYGDYNGDRKMDVLTYAQNGVWSMNLGMGDASYQAYSVGVTLPNPLTSNPPTGTGSGANVRLIAEDVNSDGKADIVALPIGGANGNNLVIYYSTGKDFVSETQLLNKTLNWGDVISLGDFNGDGNPDIMVSNTDQITVVDPDIIYLYKGAKSRYLDEVLDGLNNKTSFHFDPLSAPSTSGFYTQNNTALTYPFRNFNGPLYVLSSITNPDGIGGTSTTNYTYQDATIHLNGLGLLGFGRITSDNSVSTVRTINNYSKLLSVNGVIEMPLIGQFTYTVSGVPTLINQTAITSSIFTLNNTLRHFIKPTLSSSSDFKGATSVTSYIYDNNAASPSNDNVTNSTTNINSGLESQVTDNTYVTFTDFTNIPSRLATNKTTVNRTGQAAYIRETDYTYTNEGDINTVVQDPQSIITNGGNPKEVDLAYTYFTSGQINKITTTSSDVNVPTKTVLYGYDTYHRYATSITNPLSQVIKTAYDNKTGQAMSTIGVDNLITNYNYDGFGRNVSMTTPDGIATTRQYDWVSSADVSTWTFDPFNVSTNAQYKLTAVAPGRPGSIAFFDSFGRNVKSITDGFNSPMNIATSYDVLGNINKQSNSYSQNSNNPLVITNTYDKVKNILQSVQSNFNSTVLNTINYTYQFASGNTTVTKLNNGKTTIKIYDATGLLKSTADNAATVTYKYGSHRNPYEVDLAGNAITTMGYDAYARLKTQYEPNAGTTGFEFNSYGQLHTKTDNLNRVFTYTYDVLDRITQMVGGGETYNYQYVPSGYGINQLKQSTGPNGYICNFTYDNVDRLVQKDELIGSTFTTKYSFDQFSNLSQITYPGGAFAISKAYDPHGYLYKIKNTSDGSTIWQTNTMNAMGQYSQYSLGNLDVYKTFSDFAYPTNYTVKNGTATLHNYDFNFDPLSGNLLGRTDHRPTGDLSEIFTYDLLDRLGTVSGSDALTMSYFSNGNIQTKSDIGGYTYDPTKLNSINGISNPNTANLSPNNQLVSYSPFLKAQSIQEKNPSGQLINQLDLTYGPDQDRRTSKLYDGSGNLLSTIYFQDSYEKIVTGATTTEVNYIAGGDGLCAMYVSTNGSGKLYYVIKDHLGSILKLIDGSNTVAAEQSFDTWGRPRNPGNWTNYSLTTPNPAWLIRGYTGHEHLPNFSLINMNGRMYDPVIGRVLSPDILVQDAENTQSYNRNTYCFNNPLKYTDPSGYISSDDDEEPEETEAPSTVGWVPWSPATVLGWIVGPNGPVWINDPNVGVDKIEWLDDEGYTVTGNKDGSTKRSTVSLPEVGVTASRTLGQLANDFQEGLRETNNILGAFGLGIGAKNELINYAIRSNYKSARSVKDFSRLKQAQKIWRTSNTLGKTGSKIFAVSKALGTFAGVASIAVTTIKLANYGYNGGNDPDVYIKGGLDILMTGVGFLGPIGFIASATYFALDAGGAFGGYGDIK